MKEGMIFMNGYDIREELIRMSACSKPETVDVFKAGDPEKEIRKVGVCFLATSSVVQKAAAWGADLLITHEPTYYNNLDTLEADPVTARKKEIVDASGLTIVRFHDHMHWAIPDMIHKGFMEALQLPYTMEVKNFATLDTPVTPRQLAAIIKEKTGVGCVRLAGNPDFSTVKLSLSLGESSGDAMLERLKTGKAEIIICGEVCEWKVCEFVRDAGEMGFPMALITLGHEGSERDGMKHLTNILQKCHSDLKWKYFESGEVYEYI